MSRDITSVELEESNRHPTAAPHLATGAVPRDMTFEAALAKLMVLGVRVSGCR